MAATRIAALLRSRNVPNSGNVTSSAPSATAARTTLRISATLRSPWCRALEVRHHLGRGSRTRGNAQRELVEPVIGRDAIRNHLERERQMAGVEDLQLGLGPGLPDGGRDDLDLGRRVDERAT